MRAVQWFVWGFANPNRRVRVRGVQYIKVRVRVRTRYLVAVGAEKLDQKWMVELLHNLG